MSAPVPHLPWAPQQSQLVVLIDGPFQVDGLYTFEFRGENWKFGGCTFYVKCKQCNAPAQAGGMVGKEKVIRWALAHKCSSGAACTEGEEDKNLFRD